MTEGFPFGPPDGVGDTEGVVALFAFRRPLGMEHSKVIYGNKIFVNDILITIDGQIYDDWDFVTNTDFERWVFGNFTLDDDVTEYEKDPVYIDWLLKKNGEDGIL